MAGLNAALFIFLAGCVEPQKAVTNAPKYGTSRLAPDSVALEIGLLQLDDSQVEKFEQFWQTLDHQKLDIEFRRRLDENGIRCGVMPSQAPGVFLELTQPRPIELERLDLVQQQRATEGKLEPQSRMLVHQQTVKRRHESYLLASSESHPQANWQVRNRGRSSFGSGEHVQCVWEILSIPQSDGTVLIKYTPRINFGPIRMTIGAHERDFTYDTGQSGQRLTELAGEVVLRPGETLVLAPTGDRADLGKLFFDSVIPPDDPNYTPFHLTHRVVLVRVLQTHLDDLFGQAISAEPLIQK